jgi:site-specific recombinase XerD
MCVLNNIVDVINSSPVLGTFDDLINWFLKDCVFYFAALPIYLPTQEILNLVMNEKLNIKYPYKLCKLNNHNNNLEKEWYVEFWAFDVETNKLKRKRIVHFNKLKNIRERHNYAIELMKYIDNLLIKGFYFDKLKSKEIQFNNQIIEKKEHVFVGDLLLNLLDSKKNLYTIRTYQCFKSDIKKFSNYLKSNKLDYLNIEKLNKKNVIDYQNYLIKKGYTGKTINSCISNIKTFMNIAIYEGIIKENCFDGIKKIKQVKSRNNIAYTIEQINDIKNILIKSDINLWYYVNFMFYAFIRPTELINLKVCNIIFEQNKIMIDSGIAKNRKNCYIDIPEPLLKIINEMKLNEYDRDYYIFSKDLKPGTKKLGRNTIRETYKKLIEPLKLNNEYTLYSWKHSGVVQAFLSGADIKWIQKQGRWYSINEVDIYLKSLGFDVDFKQNNNFNKVVI